MSNARVRPNPSALVSAESFVVGNVGGSGLACHLYRAECGYDREHGIVAQPVRIDASGNVTPTAEPPLDVRIGVDCGYLYHAEGGRADRGDHPVLQHLISALDAQVLDALALRWLSERGEVSRAGERRTEELEWEPGLPLAWEMVFEVLRQENLDGPRGCYSVRELYYADSPPDEIRVAIVDFGEGPHSPTKEVGGVRIDLQTGKLKMLPRRGQSKLLHHLWAVYRRRYPDLAHLGERWQKMQEVGLELQNDRPT